MTVLFVYREFTHICQEALALNARLIGADQESYHASLEENFRLLVTKLSRILGETVRAEGS